MMVQGGIYGSDLLQNGYPNLYSRKIGDKQYSIKDHLGNVRVTFADKKIPANGQLLGFYTETQSVSTYYPFGWEIEPLSWAFESFKFGFNGKIKDEQIAGGALDYGARIYSSKIGRWLSTDPLFMKYPSLSSYNYVANNPINAVDPDGRRIYFVGGAGNDQGGWNYIKRFFRIFTKKGIKGFKRLDVSHDDPAKLKAGGTPFGDISFTVSFNSDRYYKGTYERHGVKVKKTDRMIKKAVNKIIEDITKNSLAKGEQLNLSGYSYGSVLQAHVALELADKGYKVDNLILIGSPVSKNSLLYKEILKYQKAGKIGNIHRYDIEGDKLSNPTGFMGLIKGAIQNSDPEGIGKGPHFDYSRPDDPSTQNIDEGKEADKKIEDLADDLKSKGVK